MKSRKRIAVSLALCFIMISIDVSALQQINDDDDGIEMVKGFKTKKRINKKLNVNADVTIDEQNSTGSASLGVSTEYGAVIYYCKDKRSDKWECPKKYL